VSVHLLMRGVVVWHGDRVIDSRGALEAVVRHAVELEDDYDDIEPTVTALAACGDTTLVPRLHEVLDRFLDEENFYGRDPIAGVLAGIQGVAALPVLLRASARDLGDDQDSLQSEIIELLHADRAAGRRRSTRCWRSLPTTTRSCESRPPKRSRRRSTRIPA
jgi:hypothetical protein